MKIENIVNSNGNKVANQFVIRNDRENSLIFQSYNSVVCEVFMNGGLGFKKVVHFGKNWDYSKTTGKYLHIFLKNYAHISELTTKKDIQEAIDRGHARMNESIATLYDETM